MNSPQQKFFGRTEAPGSALRRPLAGLAAASALLLASSAYAADWSVPLPDMLRGSQAAVGPATYPRWDGFYFGGQIGRSFGSAEFGNATSSQISYILSNTELQDVVSGWTTLPKGTNGSTAYGGFIGYNVQWGEVITGVELNYNHVTLNIGAQDSIGPIIVNGANQPDGSTVQYDISVASRASVAIHDLMSARARVGWTIDRLLPYAFVGVAVGNAEVSRFASVTGTKTVTPPANPVTGVPGTPVTGTLILPRNPQSESKTVIAYGFAAGLGLEVGITPNMFLRAEWEYVQFPNISDMRVNVNSARAGLGFKF